MLSLLSHSLAELKHRNFYNHPDYANGVKRLLKEPQSFVFFTNSATCDECKKIYQQLKPLSEDYVVSCPFYLVDCAQNSSAVFCQEKGIINFPKVTIFKGKNAKTPVKFSREHITSDDINIFL